MTAITTFLNHKIINPVRNHPWKTAGAVAAIGAASALIIGGSIALHLKNKENSDSFQYPLDYLIPSALAVAGSALAVAFSPLDSIRIIGLLVLVAAGYGILNDIIGCYKCVEYFTNGHTDVHKKLIPSDKPIPNALVWGVHATWFPALIAGAILAIASRVFQSKFKPLSAKYLTPILVIGAVVLFGYSHICSMLKEREFRTNPKAEDTDKFNHGYYKAQKGCQNVYLDEVPSDKRAGWISNAARNDAGYDGLAIGGVLLTIGVIGFRIFNRIK